MSRAKKQAARAISAHLQAFPATALCAPRIWVPSWCWDREESLKMVVPPLALARLFSDASGGGTIGTVR